MKLHITKRNANSKGETNKLRYEGMIPAIIYHPGKPSENIVVDKSEFAAALRQVQPGRLPTTRFILNENGKERMVVIKDIQYHVTTYEVIHLDFEELHSNTKINVKVPIECIGTLDCIGIRLGGALRQVIRYLKVNCLPKDIPDVFEIDVRTMNLRDVRRLQDLNIPNNVRPLANLKEVAVVMVKR